MEFLLLGGMILLMGFFEKVDVLKDASRALLGLKLPIGIVVLIVGFSSFARGGTFIFPAIMGIAAGFFLIMDILKVLPSTQDKVERTEIAITGFQIPIGILTVISAIIGLFAK